MRRLILLFAAILTLSATLSAQTPIDARTINVYHGKPKMVTQRDNANNLMTVHLDTDGKVTKIEYGDFTQTLSWRPDGKRITVTFESNGETRYDYINIIEYSDSTIEYESYGIGIEMTFDDLGRAYTMGLSEANAWAQMTFIYEPDSNNSAPMTIIASSSYGNTLEQQITDVKYDEYGNYTEYTSNINGFETVIKRKIYYY